MAAGHLRGSGFAIEEVPDAGDLGVGRYGVTHLTVANFAKALGVAWSTAPSWPRGNAS
jgi:hypothetical protein